MKFADIHGPCMGWMQTFSLLLQHLERHSHSQEDVLHWVFPHGRSTGSNDNADQEKISSKVFHQVTFAIPTLDLNA